MNLVKWNPWREMETFNSRFGNFFPFLLLPWTLDLAP